MNILLNAFHAKICNDFQKGRHRVILSQIAIRERANASLKKSKIMILLYIDWPLADGIRATSYNQTTLTKTASNLLYEARTMNGVVYVKFSPNPNTLR